MDRNALITKHLELPVGVAKWVAKRLPPSFELDDLIGIGNVALIRAAEKYRPEQHGGVPFGIYARHVVRGAILESVRRRRWEESTRPALDDAPEPSCAPQAAVSAERRELLRQIADAASWLSLDQRHILALHYGPREVAIEAIAAAMGRSARWAYEQRQNAIAELRARCGVALGAQSVAIRRLFVVAAKPKQPIAIDIERRQRAEVDELGRLEERVLPYLADMKRIEVLRKSIRGRYENHDAAKPAEASGDSFFVIIGPRASERIINYPKLIKSIGLKVFASIAKVTLKALEQNVDAAIVSDVTSESRVGFRTLTVVKRDVPPAKIAA